MFDFKSSPTTTVNVKSLSMSKCVELVKSGICERLLRQFAVDYVPRASGNWAAVPLVEEDLLQLMKRSSNVMVTYDGNGSQEITSLSFAESWLQKTKLRNGEVKTEVQYFGRRLDDLKEHARAHLSHSVAISRGRNANVMFCFPTCIDREAASATISKDVTHGLESLDIIPSAHMSSFTLKSLRQ